MEKLRKKNGQSKPRVVSTIRERIIHFAFLAKVRWADWMTRKTAKMSKRSLYLALILFVSAGTVYNALVLNGFWEAGALRQGSIAIPKETIRTVRSDSSWTMRQGIMDMGTWRSYADSLKLTKEGRALLDSIKRHRPALLDSIEQAESIMGKF